MAGLSPSPRGLRSKQTSSKPSLQVTPLRLPPIVIERSEGKVPRPPPPSPTPWSWYHRNCHRSPRPPPSPPSRRHRNLHKSSTSQKYNGADEMDIRMYLDANPDFLLEYVADEISARELEDWLRIKRQVDGTSPETASSCVVTSYASSGKFKLCTDYNKRERRPSSALTSIEEDVPSVVLMSIQEKLPKQSVVLLDGKRLQLKCLPFQSVKAKIHVLDYQKQRPRSTSTDSATTSPESDLDKSEFNQSDRMNGHYHQQRKEAMNSDSYHHATYSNGLSNGHVSSDDQQAFTYFNRYSYSTRQAMNAHTSTNCQSLPNGSRHMGLVNGRGLSEPRAESANGAVRKPRRMLPSPLSDKEKRILSIIEDLVVRMFPDALTEFYLNLRHEVFIVTQTGPEHTSEEHARIAKKVTLEGVPLFLNRYDLPRLSILPRHIVHYLNRNHYVAFVPFYYGFGTVVLELWSTTTYTVHDRVLLQSLPDLVSIILPYHRQYHSVLQESKMSAFLLQVAQAVFEEMLSLDQLIKKILEVAQHLVSADRASLFLVDHRNMELVSTVFDLRYEANQDSDFSKKEIRIPINKGIAGHVAMSGETMNIPDAYMDQRFNKEVDEATGYRTVSILCMPIKVRGKIIAVVQMVNKRDKKSFGADDESAFQVFSTFFGLALHHAKLYDKIKRKEQKYKVALEVLGYHNTCAEEDVETVLEERKNRSTINYNDFALNPFEVNDIEKCKGVLSMFEDLFDITKFDVTVLTRFVLTVKKNYRKVPYHNFDHGWAVANSMYVMLKHDTENRFNFNNRLALFVASLCHDLDHRGYTNKFMSEIASPLAAIYTTSTLEHHHFNMTVTILQQDGHNIFYQMSSEEYKDILDSIRQCILATDLAAFFPNLKKINKLMFESQFDWNDESHRVLGQSFCMTGADLSASAKPFEAQLRTVEIIFDEFYQQGDLERQSGRSPIAMMDRHRQDQLPSCQVEFLSQICLPCYTILAALIPNTKPMVDMVNANLENWKARAQGFEKSTEK